MFVDETSQHLLALVEWVGASEVTALMHGPTGSGKEVLARPRMIFHQEEVTFIPVNCAALPESLGKSLFAYTRRFYGRNLQHGWVFYPSSWGTLFLDEMEVTYLCKPSYLGQFKSEKSYRLARRNPVRWMSGLRLRLT